MWSLCLRTFVFSGEKEVEWKEESNFLRNRIYGFFLFVHRLDCYLDGATSSAFFVEGLSRKLSTVFNFTAFWGNCRVTALVFIFFPKSPPLLPVTGITALRISIWNRLAVWKGGLNKISPAGRTIFTVDRDYYCFFGWVWGRKIRIVYNLLTLLEAVCFFKTLTSVGRHMQTNAGYSSCGHSLTVTCAALKVRHTLRWWDGFLLHLWCPWSLTAPRPFLRLLCGLSGAWGRPYLSPGHAGTVSWFCLFYTDMS